MKLRKQSQVQRYICLGGALAVAMMAVCGMACRLGRWLPLSRREPVSLAAGSFNQPSSGFFSSPPARRVINAAISTYGGMRNWRATEGLELEMVWKTYEGTRVIEDPALVQMATTPAPQIRIHYSKIDQVLALGDKGPWAMVRGQPDQSPSIVERAHYTAATMSFFLSLPFYLKDRGVVVRGVETKNWGGQVFDAVTVGFQGGSYPWRADMMTLWFRRPTSVLERCFFVSTGKGSGFDPPPNYRWITWENHTPLNGIPLARRWSFFRAESDGTMKEKLFDIEVTSAMGNRSFLPVLFREPVIEPRIQRLPLVGGEKVIPVPISPKP